MSVIEEIKKKKEFSKLPDSIIEDAAEKLYEWYQTPKEEREKAALEGREWMLTEEIGMSAKHMGDRFINDIETVFENWKPRERFEIFKA